MNKKLMTLVGITSAMVMLTACSNKGTDKKVSKSTKEDISLVKQNFKPTIKTKTDKQVKKADKESLNFSKSRTDKPGDPKNTAVTLPDTSGIPVKDNNGVVVRDALGGVYSNGRTILTLESAKWSMKGEINNSGDMKVVHHGRNYDTLQLFGFQSLLGSMPMYFTVGHGVTYDTISLGYLGVFKKVENKNLWVPKQTDDLDYNVNLVGSWHTITGDSKLYTNFNLDHTYEKFSDASGIHQKGTYSVAPKGDNVEVTYHANSGRVDKVTYKMTSDMLVNVEFPLMEKQIRNTIPKIF